MNISQFKAIIKECLKEVMIEDLKRVCAWCGKDLGTTPGKMTGDSHGICPECKKKYFGGEESSKYQIGLDNDKAMKQAGSKFV